MSRKVAHFLFNANREMWVTYKMRAAGYTVYCCILIGLREIKNTGLIEPKTLEVTLSLVSDLGKVILEVNLLLFLVSFVTKSNFVYF